MTRLPSTRARLAALAALGVATAATLAAQNTQTSTAAFVDSSTASATVRAAGDWSPPTVRLHDPGNPVAGTVPLTVSAADAETEIAEVVVERRTAEGTWSAICEDSSAPYVCAWDTTALTDGSHRLRARATDATGLTSTSEPVTTTVANGFAVLLSDPGGVVRGPVMLTATPVHAPGPVAVRFEYAESGGTSWATACTATSSPYTCTWESSAVRDEGYDLRAVATTSGSTNTLTAISDRVEEVSLDNAAPRVTLRDPGSPLRGTVRFVALAEDDLTGVEHVVIQHAVAGTGAWQELCSVSQEPYACTADTVGLSDGAHAFRAVATDSAGNTGASAVVGDRVVDNTVASVALDDPGEVLHGQVRLSASAASTAGIGSVRFQHAPAGSSGWVEACTDDTEPYACAWDTSTVGNGLLDLRAVLVDPSGRLVFSEVIAGVRVDNTPLRAFDVQTGSAGVAGRLDHGDTLTLTFSREVQLGTVLSGWTGEATPVTLRLRDGKLGGAGAKADVLDVLQGRREVDLGAVDLREDYVKPWRTATAEAIMTARTVRNDGVAMTAVTVRVTGPATGKVRTQKRSSTMRWTPSAAVLDLEGRACSPTPVNESGPADREL